MVAKNSRRKTGQADTGIGGNGTGTADPQSPTTSTAMISAPPPDISDPSAPIPLSQLRPIRALTNPPALSKARLNPPSIRPRIRTTHFDRTAWSLSQQGKSDLEIGALLNCTALQAREGITTVETWRRSLDEPIVNAVAAEQVVIGVENAGRVLRDAQEATVLVAPPRQAALLDGDGKPQLDEDGNPVVIETSPAVYAPDHATRLAAVRAAGELAERFRPKGNGNQINVGIQTNVNGNGNGSDGGQRRSYEQRLRRVREKHGLTNDDPDELPHEDEEEPDNILDGEYEEGGNENDTGDEEDSET